MELQTLAVDDAGTVLAYTDSGVPHRDTHTYTTIFAVHGVNFNTRKHPTGSSLPPSSNQN